MGPEALAELMPGLLQLAEHPQPETREGYLGLFIYLPISFGAQFECFLADVLPVLLRGLSSDTESIRDIAFRAADVLVSKYGNTHTALLLPPLEEGLSNKDWRIRQSSVQLLGSLVQQLLRFTTDDAGPALTVERRAFVLSVLYICRSDDNPVVKHAATAAWKEVVQNSPKTLKEILPILLKRLLVHLWSSNPVKQHTAATCLGDLTSKFAQRVLPEVISACVAASSRPDVASRHGACLGLTEIITRCHNTDLITAHSAVLVPAVQRAVTDESPVVRHTGTKTLDHLLEALGTDSVITIVDGILKTATQPVTFDPAILDAKAAQLNGLEVLLLSQPHAIISLVLSAAADGVPDLAKVRLVGCLSLIKNQSTLYGLMPRILPLFVNCWLLAVGAASNGGTAVAAQQFLKDHELPAFARAQADDFCEFDSATLSSEVGKEFHRLLKKCSPEGRTAVFSQLTEVLFSEVEPAGDFSATGRHKMQSALKSKNITQNVDPGALPNIAAETAFLSEHLSEVEPSLIAPFKRAAILNAIESLLIFFQQMQFDTELRDAPLDRCLTFILPKCLVDPAAVVRDAACQAFAAFTPALRKVESATADAAVTARHTISGLITDPVTKQPLPGLLLPGLAQRSAFESLISLYTAGLAAPAHDIRELSVRGMAEAIRHMDAKAVQPVAVKVSGPLIRICSSRTPAPIRAALLIALKEILSKAAAAVRPLFPQFQLSFTRAALDTAAPAVRAAGAAGLRLSAKVGILKIAPLVSELVSSYKNTRSSDVLLRTAILNTLAEVFGALERETVASESTDEVCALSEKLLFVNKVAPESLKAAAAQCLGATLAAQCGTSRRVRYLDEQLLPALTEGGQSDMREPAAMLLVAMLDAHDDFKLNERFKTAIEATLAHEDLAVRSLGVDAFVSAATGASRRAASRSLALALLPAASKALCSLATSAGSAPLARGLRGCKKIAKLETRLAASAPPFELSKSQRVEIVLPALASLSLPNPAMKIQAERVLLHALCVRKRQLETQLESLRSSIDAARFSFLVEYSSRVLAKMAASAMSDSERE